MNQIRVMHGKVEIVTAIDQHQPVANTRGIERRRHLHRLARRDQRILPTLHEEHRRIAG